MRTRVGRRVWLGLAGVALAVAGCGPKGEEWTSGGGRFRVVFPAAPTVEEVTGKGRPTVKQASLAVRSGTMTVAWEDLPEKPELSDRERLRRAVDGAVAAVDGKARRVKEVPLDGGHPGRQVLIERDGKLLAEVRLYLVKRRLYQVLARGEPWWLESPEVRQFLSSFAVIGE